MLKRRRTFALIPGILASCLSIGMAIPALAAPTFTPLGSLSGYALSDATAISADGSTVVGNVTNPSSAFPADQAFRWTREAGMVGLPPLAAGQLSTAFGVSGDGSIVVGSSSESDSAFGSAVRWTSTGGISLVGRPDLPTSAQAVSADGSTVVGSEQLQAQRWISGDGPYHPALGGGTYAAYGVSPDGNIVVGVGDEIGGAAFRWINGVGVTYLAGDTSSLNAYAVSADGSVVVGGGANVPSRQWFLQHASISLDGRWRGCASRRLASVFVWVSRASASWQRGAGGLRRRVGHCGRLSSVQHRRIAETGARSARYSIHLDCRKRDVGSSRYANR